jgi:Putative Ig domain
VDNDGRMLFSKVWRSLSLYSMAWFLIACLLAPTKLAAWQTASLTIETSSLPTAEAGISYTTPMQASGGVSPYTWQLAAGDHLPPGLHLRRHTGQLVGTPSRPGEYHFALDLSDTDAPPSHVQREFTLVVVAGLTVEWKTPPMVSGKSIVGSLIVANHTDQAASLTVIVVAVNQIGRATALGYQHFTIEPQAEQEIPFGAEPGTGNYMVRVDAVAHFPTGKTTLRASKQTREGDLVVKQI